MVDEGLTDEERIRKFHVLLVDRFDLRLIGRYVLGVHWRRASPEQRIEFSGLFEDYLVSIYASRLGQYGGESLSVKSPRSEGKDTIVTTEVHGPRIFFIHGQSAFPQALVIKRRENQKLLLIYGSHGVIVK